MRVTIILSESEATALQHAANVEYRHPRDQARVYLRDALERAGYLAAQVPPYPLAPSESGAAPTD